MTQNLNKILHQKKKELIDEALAKHYGNKAAAARELGILRSTLVEWMKRNQYRLREPQSLVPRAKMIWAIADIDGTWTEKKIHAAEAMGVSLRTLRNWVNKYKDLWEFKQKNGVRVEAGNR